ncbi:MAG: formate dehydrogenase accessory sulfurtransferase FdhD [Acidobacteria bacterium]|nr:formate dehydrogenase accessory sulfurtransferase FdhD [Acidobacteriota bacterium]
MTKMAGAVDGGKFAVEISRISTDNPTETTLDALAVEEPLEIRLGLGRGHRPVSITMRTPGHDPELAAGFLFTEGILKSPTAVRAIKHCGKFPRNRNTIRVDVADDFDADLGKLDRHFYTTSSCGVCGKTSLEALATGARPLERPDFPSIDPKIVHRLPETLRAGQSVFDETGGLHAAALFETDGRLTLLREDVGRHNAVDKLIGAMFLENKLPLADKILFLSGRASFELLQKAVMAGIPIVCAVGAPSSLAVEAAREFGVTLLGFVRDRRFNVYAGGERIN